jgi:hypothetical protein
MADNPIGSARLYCKLKTAAYPPKYRPNMCVMNRGKRSVGSGPGLRDHKSSQMGGLSIIQNDGTDMKIMCRTSVGAQQIRVFSNVE